MKTLILSILLVCTFSIGLYAANINFNSTSPDSTASNSLGQLLDLYYNIKDALVISSAGTAALKADEFVKAIMKIDMNSLSESEQKAFMPLHEKLYANAKEISQSKDLVKQRIYFASFSDNIYSLAKEIKLSTQPIYRDYCPMKKKFWLSSESTIKNPYFGKSMPTCGSIAETLK